MKKEFRHPKDVETTQSFEVDSARRDITINSLGLTKDGGIVDYQGGVEDLKNRITVRNEIIKNRNREKIITKERLAKYEVMIKNRDDIIRKLKKSQTKTNKKNALKQQLLRNKKGASIWEFLRKVKRKSMRVLRKN